MSEDRCEFEAFEPDKGRCNAPATKFIETGSGTDWFCDDCYARFVLTQMETLTSGGF